MSLGGPKTYPFDSNGDGVADTCSLPYTRREAIARQNALLKLSARFQGDFNGWLIEACATLRAQNAYFGDNPADLAKDICQPTTRPGSSGGGGGGGRVAPPTPTPSPTPTPNATTPSAPATPTVEEGNARITVSWSEPSDGGSPITDYNVNYRPVNGTALNHDFSCDTTCTTTTTITGLTNGTKYEVAVAAVNAKGHGAWSAWSAVVTPSPTPPSAPAAPTLISNTGNSTTIAWSAPSDDGGSAITIYKLGYCHTDCGTDSNWTILQSIPALKFLVIYNLMPNTQYQARVLASNDVGDGQWSSNLTFTTPL